MSKIEEVRQVQVELEKEQRRLQSEAQNLYMEMDSLFKVFESTQLLMSDMKKQEIQQQLTQKQQDLERFQMEKFGQGGELERLQIQLLKPVLEKIDKAIQKVGNEEGYDYIFDAVAGAIVFALDSHNVTEKVLDELQNESD
tara:strand:- start:1998 stop:2420 length:423 start_codon:yes stop_codon:yes gene_type:complete